MKSEWGGYTNHATWFIKYPLLWKDKMPRDAYFTTFYSKDEHIKVELLMSYQRSDMTIKIELYSGISLLQAIADLYSCMEDIQKEVNLRNPTMKGFNWLDFIEIHDLVFYLHKSVIGFYKDQEDLKYSEWSYEYKIGKSSLGKLLNSQHLFVYPFLCIFKCLYPKKEHQNQDMKNFEKLLLQAIHDRTLAWDVYLLDKNMPAEHFERIMKTVCTSDVDWKTRSWGLLQQAFLKLEHLTPASTGSQISEATTTVVSMLVAIAAFHKVKLKDWLSSMFGSTHSQQVADFQSKVAKLDNWCSAVFFKVLFTIVEKLQPGSPVFDIIWSLIVELRSKAEPTVHRFISQVLAAELIREDCTFAFDLQILNSEFQQVFAEDQLGKALRKAILRDLSAVTATVTVTMSWEQLKKMLLSVDHKDNQIKINYWCQGLSAHFPNSSDPSYSLDRLCKMLICEAKSKDGKTEDDVQGVKLLGMLIYCILTAKTKYLQPHYEKLLEELLKFLVMDTSKLRAQLYFFEAYGRQNQVDYAWLTKSTKPIIKQLVETKADDLLVMMTTYFTVPSNCAKVIPFLKLKIWEQMLTETKLVTFIQKIAIGTPKGFPKLQYDLLVKNKPQNETDVWSSQLDEFLAMIQNMNLSVNKASEYVGFAVKGGGKFGYLEHHKEFINKLGQVATNQTGVSVKWETKLKSAFTSLMETLARLYQICHFVLVKTDEKSGSPFLYIDTKSLASWKEWLVKPDSKSAPYSVKAAKESIFEALGITSEAEFNRMLPISDLGNPTLGITYCEARINQPALTANLQILCSSLFKRPLFLKFFFVVLNSWKQYCVKASYEFEKNRNSISEHQGCFMCQQEQQKLVADLNAHLKLGLWDAPQNVGLFKTREFLAILTMTKDLLAQVLEYIASKPTVITSDFAHFVVFNNQYMSDLKHFNDYSSEFNQNVQKALKKIVSSSFLQNLRLLRSEQEAVYLLEIFKAAQSSIPGSMLVDACVAALQSFIENLRKDDQSEGSEVDLQTVIEIISQCEPAKTHYQAIVKPAFLDLLKQVGMFTAEQWSLVAEITSISPAEFRLWTVINGIHSRLLKASNQGTKIGDRLRDLSDYLLENKTKVTDINGPRAQHFSKDMAQIYELVRQSHLGHSGSIIFRLSSQSQLFFHFSSELNAFVFDTCVKASVKSDSAAINESVMPADDQVPRADKPAETDVDLSYSEFLLLKEKSEQVKSTTTETGGANGAEPELIDEKKFVGYYTKSVNIVRIDSSHENCFAKLKKIGELRKSILDKLNKMVRTGEVFDIIKALSKHHSLVDYRNIIKPQTENNLPYITVQMKGDLKPIESLNSALEDILTSSTNSKLEFLAQVKLQKKEYHFWSKLSGLQISELLKYLESGLTGEAADQKARDFIRLFQCIKDGRVLDSRSFKYWASAESVKQYGSYERIADLNRKFGRSQDEEVGSLSSERKQFTIACYSQEPRANESVDELPAIRMSTTFAACMDGFKDNPQCLKNYSSYLFCNQYTTEEFLDIFLHRAVFDPERKPYLILDMQLLHFTLRDKILRFLAGSLDERLAVVQKEGPDRNEMTSSILNLTGQSKLNLNTNITLVVPLKDKSNLMDEIKTRYSKRHFHILESQAIHRNTNIPLDKVVVVMSETAGQGKTFAIQSYCKNNNLKLLVITLAGSMTPELLDSRLDALYHVLGQQVLADREKLALRIKLDMVDGSEESFDYLNQLLFKLCIVQMIEYKYTMIDLSKVQKFFIEVQNTIETGLEQVPLICYVIKQNQSKNYWRVSIKWNYTSLDASMSDSNSQIEEENEKRSVPDTYTPPSINFSELNNFGLREALILHRMTYSREEKEREIGVFDPHEMLMTEEETLNKFSTDQKVRNLLKSCVGALEQVCDSGLAVNGHEKAQLRLDLAYQRYDSFSSDFYEMNALIEPLQAQLAKSEISEQFWLQNRRLIVLIYHQRQYKEILGSVLLKNQALDEDHVRNFESDLFKIVFDNDPYAVDEDCESEISKYNFFHVKTLLQLYKNYFQVMEFASALHWSEYKQDPSPETDAERRNELFKYRIGFTFNVLRSLRDSAFNQILRLPSAQEVHIRRLKNNRGADAVQTDQENSTPSKNYTFCLVKEGEIQLLQSNEESNQALRSLVLQRNQQNAVLFGQLDDQDQFKTMLADLVATLEHQRTTLRQDVNTIRTQIEGRNSQQPTCCGSRKKQFVFTKDNFLKMTLILQRASLGVPIVLMGESGCGKTFMVEYIAKVLLSDTFRTLTLHMGVSESKFEDFLTKVIKIAKDKKDQRVWLFLDEVNTSPLITSITELITERTAHFMKHSEADKKMLPKNVIIIAACNPYRLKSDDRSEASLSAKGPRPSFLSHKLPAASDSRSTGSGGRQPGKSSALDLTHKVFPVPNSMLSYVFDFGQISEEDEKPYIRGMLEDYIKDFPKDKQPNGTQKSELVNAICLGQQHIQKNGQKSSASIRDVRRFLQLMRQFVSNPNYTLQHSALLAFYCGYSIRQQGTKDMNIELRKEATDFNNNVQKKLKLLSKGEQKIQPLFDSKSSEFLDLLKVAKMVPEDIAVNRPLRENLYIMVQCVLARVPLFICGRPGTSKSVSIEIIRNIFNSGPRNSEFNEFYPEVEIYPIWGSKDTMADDVERVFERARKNAKEHTGSADGRRDLVHLIVFDEMGIADANDHNPLKVLHPLLEPSQDDAIPNLAFIGLSNTVLDASKMNRMLYVHRYDMGEEDLKAILIQFKIDEKIQTKLLSKLPGDQFALRIEDWLVETYCSYRKVEAKDSVHKSFSGPRDFYSLCKWLKHNLDCLITTTLGQDLQPAQVYRRLAQFVCFAIERNFSGRKIEYTPLDENVMPQYMPNKQFVDNSSYLMKSIFMSLFCKEVGSLTPEVSEELVSRHCSSRDLLMNNLNDPHARHLMLFLEKRIYVDTLSKIFERWWEDKKERLKSTLKEDNVEEKERIKRQRFVFMNEESGDLISIFNNFKECVSDGAFVLLRKMDNLYPCCYDIFNQRYTITWNDKKEEVRTCKMNLGSIEEEVEVNKNFKCVILIDNDQAIQDVEKEWPTALLNRFEKHELLKYDFYTQENQQVEYMLAKKLKDFAKAVVPDKFIHNYSNLLIESAVIGDISSLKDFRDMAHDDYLKAVLDENKHAELTNKSSEWYRDIFSMDSRGITRMDSQLSIGSQDSIDNHTMELPRDVQFDGEGKRTAVEESFEKALQTFHQMFNWNYLLVLHRRFANNPEEASFGGLNQEGEQLFQSYKDAHKKSLLEVLETRTDNKLEEFLVVFSLEDARESAIRKRWEQYKHQNAKTAVREGEIALWQRNVEILDYQRWLSTSQIQQQLDDLVIRLYPSSMSADRAELDLLIICFNNKEEWDHLNLYMDYIKRSITQRKSDLQTHEKRETNQQTTDLKLISRPKQVLLIAHNPIFEDIKSRSPPLVHFVSTFKPFVLDMIRWTEESPNLENILEDMNKKLGMTLEEYFNEGEYMKEQIKNISEEMFHFKEEFADESEKDKFRELLTEDTLLKFYVEWMKNNGLDLKAKIHSAFTNDDQERAGSSEALKIKNVHEKLNKIIGKMVTSKLKAIFVELHHICGLNYFLALASVYVRCDVKAAELKLEFELLRDYIVNSKTAIFDKDHTEELQIFEIESFRVLLQETPVPVEEGDDEPVFEVRLSNKLLQDRDAKFWKKLLNRDKLVQTLRGTGDAKGEDDGQTSSVFSKLVKLIRFEMQRQSSSALMAVNLHDDCESIAKSEQFFAFFFEHTKVEAEKLEQSLLLPGVEFEKQMFTVYGSSEDKLKRLRLFSKYVLESVLRDAETPEVSLDDLLNQFFVLWSGLRVEAYYKDGPLRPTLMVCYQAILAKALENHLFVLVEMNRYLAQDDDSTMNHVFDTDQIPPLWQASTFVSRDLLEIILHKGSTFHNAKTYLHALLKNKSDMGRDARNKCFEDALDKHKLGKNGPIELVVDQIIADVVQPHMFTLEEVDADSDKKPALLSDFQALLEIIPLRVIDPGNTQTFKMWTETVVILLEKYVVPACLHSDLANLETEKYNLETLKQQPASQSNYKRILVLWFFERISQFVTINNIPSVRRDLQKLLNNVFEASDPSMKIPDKFIDFWVETYFSECKDVHEFRILQKEPKRRDMYQTYQRPAYVEEEGMMEMEAAQTSLRSQPQECESFKQRLQALLQEQQTGDDTPNAYYFDQVLVKTSQFPAAARVQLDDLNSLALLDVAFSHEETLKVILRSRHLPTLLDGRYNMTKNHWLGKIVHSNLLSQMWRDIKSEDDDDLKNNWRWINQQLVQKIPPQEGMQQFLESLPDSYREDPKFEPIFCWWMKVFAQKVYNDRAKPGVARFASAECEPSNLYDINYPASPCEQPSLPEAISDDLFELEDATADATAAETRRVCANYFLKHLAGFSILANQVASNPFYEDDIIKEHAHWLNDYIRRAFRCNLQFKYSIYDFGRFLSDQAHKLIELNPQDAGDLNYPQFIRSQFATALERYNSSFLTDYQDSVAYNLRAEKRMKDIEGLIEEGPADPTSNTAMPAWREGVDLFSHLTTAIDSLRDYLSAISSEFKRGYSRELCSLIKLDSLKLGDSTTQKLNNFLVLVGQIHEYLPNSITEIGSAADLTVLDAIGQDSQLYRILEELLEIYNGILTKWKKFSPDAGTQKKDLKSANLHDFLRCTRKRLLRELCSKISSASILELEVSEAIRFQIGYASQNHPFITVGEDFLSDLHVVFTNNSVELLRECIEHHQQDAYADISYQRGSNDVVRKRLKLLHERVVDWKRNRHYISEVAPGVSYAKLGRYYHLLMKNLLENLAEERDLQLNTDYSTMSSPPDALWTFSFPLLEAYDKLAKHFHPTELTTTTLATLFSTLTTEDTPQHAAFFDLSLSQLTAWSLQQLAGQSLDGDALPN